MIATALFVGLVAQSPNELPSTYKPISLPKNILQLAQERITPDKAWAVIEEGNTLTFIRKHNTDKVVIAGSIQAELERVKGDLWAVRLEMPHVERGLFTIQFVSRNQRGVVTPGQQLLFRGSKATKPSPMVEKFKGKFFQKLFETAELGKRTASIYLPPNPKNEKLSVIYMVDGQTAEPFAKALEYQILNGKIRPTALVGVHANFNNRTAEYVPWVRREEFDRHFKYYLETIIPYIDKKYEISQDPHDRAVFGFSNGAEWASIMALTHPESFYWAMPFSISKATPPEDFWKDKTFSPETPRPVFLLASGTFEPGFRNSTETFTKFLKEQGYRARFQLYPSGHDFAMWHLAFNQYVPKMFPPRKGALSVKR